MYAKKSLGQNFLKSKSVLKKIVEVGEVVKTDFVLEIGPGKGALTKELLETGAKILAVEKDDNLFPLLEEKFEKEISSGKLDLMHGDILETDLSDLENYKLVANIPYNITGEIIRSFLEKENQPKMMVLLVQKEVAERIVAKDGKESILSMSIKAYGEPKYHGKVSRKLFSPSPNVDSAIISIKNISKNFFESISEQEFFRLVKTGFSQKRKKLSNNLKNTFGDSVSEKIKSLGLDENIRAEELSKEDWKKFLLTEKS